MVRSTRKISSRVLSGIILLQVLLPLVLLLATAVTRYNQKQRILKEHLYPELFSEFVIPAGPLASEAQATGEMKFEGVLYDVSSIRREGSFYRITALADTTETRLRELTSLGRTKEQTSNLHSFFPFVPMFYQQPERWCLITFRRHVALNGRYHLLMPQCAPSGHSPPPRV